MTTRLAIAVLLVAATAGVTGAARTPTVQPPVLVGALPMTMGAWRGAEAGVLDDETLRILAADAYVNRSYSTAAAGAPVGMYAAYYAQQKPGVSIHSPLHCLPGTGWEPIDVTTRSIQAADGSTNDVRRLVVRKNRERAVVLYWYAIHGRTVGSEIASKLWLLHDSVRFQRSDAALIRVSVPVTESIDAAEQHGVSFVRTLLPYVSHLWS